MDFPLAYIQTLVAVVTGTVSILGIVFGWFGIAWAFLGTVLSRKKSNLSRSIPRITPIVHPPVSSNEFWWSLGTSGWKPAMHIGGDLQITNTTNFKIAVAGVKLKKPSLRGYVMVRKPDDAICGGYALPELSMQHARPPPRNSTSGGVYFR